jgi:signal transduction histidine kinase
LLTGEVTRLKTKTEAEQDALILQICENTRDIMATINEVVWIVNSQHDTLDAFAIYVCKYTQQFLSTSPLRCRLDVPDELPNQKLDQAMRRNLFLATKEALTNAVKHSQATELRLRISLVGTLLNVIVQDNGIGFVPAQTVLDRHGLANMALRMKEIGGTCLVTSRPGEGCQIHFKVFLKRDRIHKRLYDLINPRRFSNNSPGQRTP